MKKYKSLFNEITISPELVNSKISSMSPEIQEFINMEILPLSNGVYSKNFYKLIQALYVMDLVQGLKPKITLLFIKHFLNYLLDEMKYSFTPSTFISNIVWDAIKTNDSSFIFSKVASADVDEAIIKFNTTIESDMVDIGGGYSFNPEYADMQDWEDQFGEEVISYVRPNYVGIIPTVKGFELTYIGSGGQESYPNIKLLKFLSSGTVGQYNFFNAKFILTYFNRVINSNKSVLMSWLKR